MRYYKPDDYNEELDDEKPYDFVNHPKHYNNYSKETIDMMVDIFGLENTIMWCEMTAFKYRMRMGTKPDTPIQQDIDKESWYLNKKQELQNKLIEKQKLHSNLITATHIVNGKDTSF